MLVLMVYESVRDTTKRNECCKVKQANRDEKQLAEWVVVVSEREKT